MDGPGSASPSALPAFRVLACGSVAERDVRVEGACLYRVADLIAVMI